MTSIYYQVKFLKRIIAGLLIIIVMFIINSIFQGEWRKLYELRLQSKDNEISYWQYKYVNASVIPVVKLEDIMREVNR